MKTIVLLVFVLWSAVGLRVSGGDEQAPFELTTVLGETFHHCRIIKATPEGITVSHENGVSKILFDNLNDEWKKMFHYSPDRASAFQKDEAARRTVADEKRRQLQKDYEKQQTKQLGEMAAAEGRQLRRLEEALARQQVEAATAAATAVASQPGVLIPLPGDPTAYLGAGAMTSRTATVGSTGTTVQSFTEVLVPATTPIGQIYTPGATGSQRYIINQGAVFTPGDGTVYYTNPGYGYPGYVTPGYITPGYTNPPIIVCPPGTVRPGFPAGPAPVLRSPGANITVRPGVIHLGR